MYKNYFYLNRLTNELKQLLNGASLLSAFSQEKNVLVLEFGKLPESFYLLINVSQNEPYIQYRQEFHRAKKNVTDIFRGFLPAKVTNVEIAEKDRVIRLILDKKELVFFIRGKDTNVVLTEESEIRDSFKKTDEVTRKKIGTEIQSLAFTSDYYFPDFSEVTNNAVPELKKKFPYLGKDIISEAQARTGSEGKEFRDKLNGVVQSFYYKSIAVFFDETVQRLVFVPEDFRIFRSETKELFSSYLEAINYFLVNRFRYERTQNYKKIIEKHLEQQLSRLAARINEIRNKLQEPPKEEKYRETANLLLSYPDVIPKGAKEAVLTDFNNEKVVIKLDERLDSRRNAELYFEKAKNEKQNRLMLAKLFDRIEIEYKRLLEQNKKFENAKNNEEYTQIMADLKLREEDHSGNNQEDSSAYRHFLIEKKYHLYVGKDSKNNDQLTTRFAKQNDYWFHARSVSGSHAVLRIENTKEVVPKSVLKKAASIAAFYSKAKTSKLAPVAYTLKKYVVKRKGMEPGAVNLLKESVLLVEPGIPDDCEYLNE